MSTSCNAGPLPVAKAQALPLAGILLGFSAASIGALYTVFARLGIAHGMHSPELTFLRFAVAGLLTLPILILAWQRDASVLKAQWRVWLAICFLAGSPFGLLMFGALQFAPASHAAVFPFVAMSVLGTLLTAAFLQDPLTRRKGIGIAVVVLGLLVLSGLDAQSFSPRALLGDAMFVAAGGIWAGFGVLLRKHRLDPLLATAVVSFSALLTYVPVYLWHSGLVHLSRVDGQDLLLQVLVQGAIAGAGTLYTYSKTVALLGPARAAVFPALAPCLAALLAWPVLQHVPSRMEVLGMLLAMAGLLISVTTRRIRH